MKKFLSLIVVLMLAFGVKAQFVSITEAVDFTFSDNGSERTLFEVLDSGQHALLYFFNYQSTEDVTTAIINEMYNELGKNQNDVYTIGLDPANESVLLNQWAYLNEVEFPLVAKDKAYYISQTYSGSSFGLMLPTLVLIAPNHDVILKEIWPISSAEQVVGIINDNLVTGDDNTGDDETPVGLAAPTNVIATATSATTIVLTWDAVDGATEYNIYTPASFDNNVLGLTETTYTFEGLTADTEYCFNVSAVSQTDESDTEEACATTQTEDEDDNGDEPEYPEQTTVPEAPVINVYAENSGLIVIEWEAVETAIFYYVYYNGNLVGDGQVMGTEVEILVNPETTYCFTVTAVNTVGESEHSNEACATTPAEEGEEPENPDSTIELDENGFVIYPNPVNDRLYIEAETEIKEVVVYDVYGRHQVAETPSHQGNVTVDVADMKSGVYFVKVVTEKGEAVQRFIKK
ncbi:MAG: T9SS type A sorting domain-containing protein [Bacteroidales bacterium]|nr:T9SS type A sorting domain-containing protein [Bacteroidales bacterium]